MSLGFGKSLGAVKGWGFGCYFGEYSVMKCALEEGKGGMMCSGVERLNVL